MIPLTFIPSKLRMVIIRLACRLGLVVCLLPCLAFANVPVLSENVHRRLLLNGRPQVGLWQALLKEEKARTTKTMLK